MSQQVSLLEKIEKLFNEAKLKAHKDKSGIVVLLSPEHPFTGSLVTHIAETPTYIVSATYCMKQTEQKTFNYYNIDKDNLPVAYELTNLLTLHYLEGCINVSLQPERIVFSQRFDKDVYKKPSQIFESIVNCGLDKGMLLSALVPVLSNKLEEGMTALKLGDLLLNEYLPRVYSLGSLWAVYQTKKQLDVTEAKKILSEMKEKCPCVSFKAEALEKEFFPKEEKKDE